MVLTFVIQACESSTLRARRDVCTCAAKGFYVLSPNPRSCSTPSECLRVSVSPVISIYITKDGLVKACTRALPAVDVEHITPEKVYR